MGNLATYRLHAIIEGTVQGVGFRYFVADSAQALDITGWVRNRWDGSVEVMAEGSKPELDIFLNALYRGPRAADVRGVNPKWLEATGEYSSFQVRMTSS